MKDRHRERLKAGAQVKLDEKGSTLTKGEVERLKPIQPESKVLYAGVGRLMGEAPGAGTVFKLRPLPEQPPLVTPMFDATVLTDRPTLSWKPVPGATAYSVTLTLTDDATGIDKELWMVQTKEAKLTYPAKKPPLEFGRAYEWQVRVSEGGKQKVVWGSAFDVAAKATADALLPVKSLGQSKDPADWLLAALAYREYSVHDEALPLFERLAKLQPKEGGFQLALAFYSKQAGRLAEARAALARAERLGIADMWRDFFEVSFNDESPKR